MLRSALPAGNSPPVRPRARSSRGWLLALLALPLVLALSVVVDYFAYPLLMRPDRQDFNKGINGLWLGSRWYLGRAGEHDLSEMCARLRGAQVRYAYFHVRGIDRSGSLKYHQQKEAAALVRYLHDHAPGVKAIAWVGALSLRSGGEVGLGFQRVRRKMASEARWLTDACGFDGIQWDYESCPDGDLDFLRLLAETRSQLGPDKLLSIAVPMWWSSRYYRPVARSCDQVAVMCYDTGCFLPRAYALWVADEVARVTAAVAAANPLCKVVFGVPTYKDKTIYHHAYTENLAMALIGVKDGLGKKRAALSAFEGIAPYADFTTGSAEWSQYRSYWLCR